MKIILKEKEYELDFDIGFAIHLDEKYSLKQSIGDVTELEFGIGVATVYPRLAANDIRSIIEVFKAGLEDVKTVSYTEKDLRKAVSDKVREVGGIDKLAEQCIGELERVGLYDHILDPQVPTTDGK